MGFLSNVPNGDIRQVIRHFTPNWFTANMGTGILALMLALFPYGHWGQAEIAKALWCINSFFFALFSILFLSRAIFYFRDFQKLFDHPVQSLFIGAIPMGFATNSLHAPALADKVRNIGNWKWGTSDSI